MKKIFAFVVAVLAVAMMSSLAALAQSPNCTTIPPASSITDGSGVVWTLDGSGNSYENGTADGGADINLLLYFNSNMYADTISYGWFEHSSSSGWYNISGDPRGSSCSGGGASPNGTTIPSASSITDNSGTVWTLDGSGNSYENGTADGGADISLLLWYNGNIYADTYSYGWFEHSSSSGWYSISGDPRGGGGVQPNGVSAPSGYHWATTFDDEFTSDSSINTNYWNGGASNTDWCDVSGFPGGVTGGVYMFSEPSDNPCESNYGGLALSSSGLTETTPEGGPSAAIQSGGTTASGAKFIQEFGYWEASFKVPNMSDGGISAHSDFWMHPIPEGVDAVTEWSPEFDVGERPTWLDQNGCTSGSNNNTQMFFGADGANAYYGDSGGDDLSQNFHTYGLWWNNDGSGPYGSIQMYLDGSAVFSSPHVLNSGDTNLANGIYTFLSLDDNCDSPSDPFIIQYVRVWQLNSN